MIYKNQKSLGKVAHSLHFRLFINSAGRIDPHAVEICGILNERDDCYTTSSCAGRCFMYRGSGIKSTTNFKRFRISHELIQDPIRFFDLATIETDLTGGGDPLRTIGQYDYKDIRVEGIGDKTEESKGGTFFVEENTTTIEQANADGNDHTIWLRFEPFILHVACRSISSAAAIMDAARPAFKNVGLTTWKKNDGRYLVAIWGDEGLEMPLCTKTGKQLHADDADWLADLVNERHERNWKKIQRFCKGVREMPSPTNYDDGDEFLLNDPSDDASGGRKIPKSFDVIGDIAYLHSMPDEQNAEHIGNAILEKNKSIKVVVARRNTLEGTERAPGSDGLVILAGVQRYPLITTHQEYGMKCVVDLNHTFFSPRMGQERLRICQNVARGEHVLVLFAGVGMEALQIAGRTEASSVIAVELNEVAITCANRAQRLLERNKAVKCAGAADRLKIIQGDVLQVLAPDSGLLDQDQFDRILAPRPKEGALDGDLGSGDGGEAFLNVIIPRLKENGGECHWYDFVADHEFPTCERTKRLIERVCEQHGLRMKVLHVANAGSVAMRQLRVCMDFKVFANSQNKASSQGQ